MIISVFHAKLGQLDEEYAKLSTLLRKAAFEKFGCIDFKSVEQDGEEITYSVWPDDDHVRRWKNFADHLRAQQMASRKWYVSFHTITAVIIRDRRHP